MSLARYAKKKQNSLRILLKEIVRKRVSYLFIAPFAIVFGLFVVAPVAVSIYYSFSSQYGGHKIHQMSGIITLLPKQLVKH